MQMYKSFGKDCSEDNSSCKTNKKIESQIGVHDTINRILFPIA